MKLIIFLLISCSNALYAQETPKLSYNILNKSKELRKNDNLIVNLKISNLVNSDTLLVSIPSLVYEKNKWVEYDSDVLIDDPWIFNSIRITKDTFLTIRIPFENVAYELGTINNVKTKFMIVLSPMIYNPQTWFFQQVMCKEIFILKNK
ncbi:MAG: hypothetical protein ABL872_18450 [Lacibacter sp.]